jgi:hypothetical protein
MLEQSAAWLGGLVLILVIILLWVVARIDATLRRAERKLDIFMRCSGYDPGQIAALEAESLVKAGRKIEAIRVYRELTGARLAEAKAFIESIK